MKRRSRSQRSRSEHKMFLCWWSSYDIYWNLEKILGMLFWKALKVIKAKELYKMSMGPWIEELGMHSKEGGMGLWMKAGKLTKLHGYIFWMLWNWHFNPTFFWLVASKFTTVWILLNNTANIPCLRGTVETLELMCLKSLLFWGEKNSYENEILSMLNTV